MQQIFNALGVLAFLGVLLLLFGMSAVLRMVRELQKSANARLHLGASALPQLVEGGSQMTYVLVLDERCTPCRERAAALSRLVGPGDVDDIVVLGNAPAISDWVSDAGVRVVVDADVWNSAAVTATPTLMLLDRSGTVLWRSVVGSDDDLAEMLSLQSATNQQAQVPIASTRL